MIYIDIKDIVKLKEDGMSDEKIVEQLASQGRKVTRFTIARRLKEYYDRKGKGEEKPKAKRKELPMEEIVRLKEAGMSDEKIIEQLANQGIEVGRETLSKRLTEYYENIGAKKPKAKTKARKELPIEEIVRLKESGMTDKKIVEHLSNQGIKVSHITIMKRLTEYYENIGEEKPKAKTKARKELPIEEIIRLKESGMTDKKIVE